MTGRMLRSFKVYTFDSKYKYMRSTSALTKINLTYITNSSEKICKCLFAAVFSNSKFMHNINLINVIQNILVNMHQR